MSGKSIDSPREADYKIQFGVQCPPEFPAFPHFAAKADRALAASGLECGGNPARRLLPAGATLLSISDERSQKKQAEQAAFPHEQQHNTL